MFANVKSLAKLQVRKPQQKEVAMNIQRKICALLFTVLLLSPMYALAGRVDVVQVVQWLGVGLPVSLPEGVGGDTVL